MHVDIIIPTFDRLELLKQTVNSIQNGVYKDVSIFIVLDGNPALIKDITEMPAALIYNTKRKDWVFSMNRALQYAQGDAVIYAADDLVFHKACILTAVEKLKEAAPDGDALVAITQDIKGCSTAFGMMGRKFIDRFPGRAVICPDYIHYGGDWELGQYARQANLFTLCPEAKVTHHRPKDATYRKAKPVEAQDFWFIRERKAKGFLWGRDFGRVRK